jgi:hypothetical protein
VEVRRTFSARGPFGPWPTSNSTLSPSRRSAMPEALVDPQRSNLSGHSMFLHLRIRHARERPPEPRDRRGRKRRGGVGVVRVEARPWPPPARFAIFATKATAPQNEFDSALILGGTLRAYLRVLDDTLTGRSDGSRRWCFRVPTSSSAPLFARRNTCSRGGTGGTKGDGGFVPHRQPSFLWTCSPTSR